MSLNKKIFLLSLIFLFLKPLNFWAENVILPVKGLVTVSVDSVPVSVEWNEDWFSEKSSFEYNHNLARIAGIFSTVSYVDVQNFPLQNELVDCYKKLGFQNKNIELHYDVDYSDETWGNNQTAFSFAFKQIATPQGKKNLVFVVIRGTPISANEWISNINISDKTKNQEDFHEGFYNSAQHILNYFENFLKTNDIASQESYFFITGHSRGASVANLFSYFLAQRDDFDTAKIFTYTIACPNVTTKSDFDDAKYKFIWNIDNGEDLIPYMPIRQSQNIPGWNFNKYGNTRILVNSWNTDSKLYEEDFLPKMNEFYKKFMLRDFCPFKTGTFFPGQLTQIFAKVYPNVNSFYNRIPSARTLGEKSANKIFIPERKFFDYQEKNNQTGLLTKGVSSWLMSVFGVETDILTNAFIDMHASENYLSWLLCLPENQVFSQNNSCVVELEGFGNYSILDKDGNCLGSMINGNVDFPNLKTPIGANSLFQNSVQIGFPKNQEFMLLISKESLIPTPIKVTVKTFSASGQLIKLSETVKISPYIRHIYSLKLNEDCELLVKEKFEKSHRKIAKDLKIQGNLLQENDFKVFGEVSISTTGVTNVGAIFGTRKFYGSLLFAHNNVKFGNAVELCPGIGNQVPLYGMFLLNTEFYSDLFFALGDDVIQEEKFALVPKMRMTVQMQPRKRVKFFGGVNFDFMIKDFNDHAFTADYRIVKLDISEYPGRVNIIPSVIFGVRF